MGRCKSFHLCIQSLVFITSFENFCTYLTHENIVFIFQVPRYIAIEYDKLLLLSLSFKYENLI